MSFYKYSFVRFYYTGKFSGKFVDVGVVVYYDGRLLSRMIDVDAASIPANIDAKRLRSALLNVSDSIANCKGDEIGFQELTENKKIDSVRFSIPDTASGDGESALESLFNFYAERRFSKNATSI